MSTTPLSVGQAVWLLDEHGEVSTNYLWFIEEVFLDGSLTLRREDGKLRLPRYPKRNILSYWKEKSHE